MAVFFRESKTIIEVEILLTNDTKMKGSEIRQFCEKPFKHPLKAPSMNASLLVLLFLLRAIYFVLGFSALGEKIHLSANQVNIFCCIYPFLPKSQALDCFHLSVIGTMEMSFRCGNMRVLSKGFFFFLETIILLIPLSINHLFSGQPFSHFRVLILKGNLAAI